MKIDEDEDEEAIIERRRREREQLLKKLAVSDDSNMSAPSAMAVSDSDAKIKAPAKEEKPRKKTRTESIIEEAKKIEPERKEKKNDWDMFAEADNFKGSIDVSTNRNRQKKKYSVEKQRPRNFK